MIVLTYQKEQTIQMKIAVKSCTLSEGIGRCMEIERSCKTLAADIIEERYSYYTKRSMFAIRLQSTTLEILYTR